jgi:hypothetical protein
MDAMRGGKGGIFECFVIPVAATLITGRHMLLAAPFCELVRALLLRGRDGISLSFACCFFLLTFLYLR